MALPIEYNGLPLKEAYSGSLDTSRYSGMFPDGATVTIDIIQSLPKKGRWRHVVRMLLKDTPDSFGAQASTTVTLTFDHPENQPAVDNVRFVTDFFTAITGFVDEVSLGQQ